MCSSTACILFTKSLTHFQTHSDSQPCTRYHCTLRFTAIVDSLRFRVPHTLTDTRYQTVPHTPTLTHLQNDPMTVSLCLSLSLSLTHTQRHELPCALIIYRTQEIAAIREEMHVRGKAINYHPQAHVRSEKRMKQRRDSSLASCLHISW